MVGLLKEWKVFSMMIESMLPLKGGEQLQRVPTGSLWSPEKKKWHIHRLEVLTSTKILGQRQKRHYTAAYKIGQHSCHLIS